MKLRMVERPVRAPATAVAAGNVAGDVTVVFELVEVARDGGSRDPLTERGHELRSAETPPCSARATAIASLTRFMPMPTNAPNSTGSGASE